LVLDYQMYISEKPAARVPAGISVFAGRSTNCNHIVGIVFNDVGYIRFKTKISIICSAYLLTVYPDIAMQHDAFEIESYLFSLPVWICFERFPIPTNAHRLKSTTSAGVLIPRLLDLKIVRQIK